MIKSADNLLGENKTENGCEVITVGKPFEGIKFGFRETCFGITKVGNKYLFTQKNAELSMVGGGVEAGETHAETLKREYLEESGFKVKDVKHFIDVDAYWIAGRETTFPMRSLAHIYLVECEDEHESPTEENHKPVLLTLDEAYSALQLPYHRKAIEYYINSLK